MKFYLVCKFFDAMYSIFPFHFIKKGRNNSGTTQCNVTLAYTSGGKCGVTPIMFASVYLMEWTLMDEMAGSHASLILLVIF